MGARRRGRRKPDMITAQILKRYEEVEAAVRSGFPKTLWALSSVLERSVPKNERLMRASGKKEEETTAFHGERAPGMSIQRYAERIYRYAGCSNSCVVVAYIYMERFLRRSGVYLTSLNVHRLLITSTLLAAKFVDDECYNNAHYAKVGGVSTSDLNRLEMKFLVSIDFGLHVTVRTFEKYSLLLEDEVRGSFNVERPIGFFCGLGKCKEEVSNNPIPEHNKSEGHLWCK